MNPKHSPLFVLIVFIVLTGCSTKSYRAAAVAPPPPAPVIVPPAMIELPLRQIEVSHVLADSKTPQFDSVDDMIARSEAAYERGRSEFRAGHLEVAKTEFNAAVDVILAGKISMQSDRRLQRQFDSLVDRIHAYELQALKQGDGFAEPTYQPAPLDELKTLTFPENPQLRDKVRADAANTSSDIPLVINSQVASFIEYFSNGRGRSSLEAGLRRSGRLRDMITRILAEEGVPLDLIYLAQAESAFQYLAKSHKGATGVWQFISGTGRVYGLEANWWSDDRLNPEKATRAAAKHLKDLYNLFGDWYLALAAYNCGSGCVQRAVERTGYADFWELSSRRALPQETRNYVPIILALTVIAKNPQKYAIDELLPEAPLVYDTVTVSAPVDLRLVSEIVGSSVERIRELNPNLLRLTTPKVPEYDLRIPLATKDIFLKRIAMIPAEKRVYWRWHTVNYGETLSGIAKKLGSSPKAIAEVNNIDADQPLRENAELVIPVSSPAARGRTYQVRKGDTLSSVARRYKVSADDLMSANNLVTSSIQRGMLLTIPASASAATAPKPSAKAPSAKAKVTRTRASVRKSTPKKVVAAAPKSAGPAQGQALPTVASNQQKAVIAKTASQTR